MTYNFTKMHSSLLKVEEIMSLFINDEVILNEIKDQTKKADVIYKNLTSGAFISQSQNLGDEIMDFIEASERIASIVQFAVTCEFHGIYPFTDRTKKFDSKEMIRLLTELGDQP